LGEKDVLGDGGERSCSVQGGRNYRHHTMREPLGEEGRQKPASTGETGEVAGVVKKRRILGWSERRFFTGPRLKKRTVERSPSVWRGDEGKNEGKGDKIAKGQPTKRGRRGTGCTVSRDQVVCQGVWEEARERQGFRVEGVHNEL